MPGELILIADDEPNIVQLARMYLEREGFRVEAIGDGRSALDAVDRFHPALIVLDIMMPELDGLEVCRQLRGKKDLTPILMLTARDEDIDKILGLEMGADDYLTKPFNPRELVARVKAILRRGKSSTHAGASMIHIGDVLIDTGSREVTIKGKQVDMRSQEFNLLFSLAEHKGLVLTRDQLLDLAWGYDYGGQTRTVDVHIGHLRKRLEGSSVQIKTVTGFGYKLLVD